MRRYLDGAFGRVFENTIKQFLYAGVAGFAVIACGAEPRRVNAVAMFSIAARFQVPI